MRYGLSREQPHTLLCIWENVRRWGRVPTAMELAKTLGIPDRQTVYMRIRRLQEDGYLIKRVDGTWTINSTEVVDQPESARLLLLVQDRCANSPRGKVTRGELAMLAREVGIPLKDEDLSVLTNKLVTSDYLTEPEHWLGHYQVGPRVHKEYEFLKLLADKLERTSERSAKREHKTQSRRSR